VPLTTAGTLSGCAVNPLRSVVSWVFITHPENGKLKKLSSLKKASQISGKIYTFFQYFVSVLKLLLMAPFMRSRILLLRVDPTFLSPISLVFVFP